MSSISRRSTAGRRRATFATPRFRAAPLMPGPLTVTCLKLRNACVPRRATTQDTRFPDRHSLPLPSGGVVLRKAVIVALCLSAVVVPSLGHAATPIRGQTLMPGVVYSKQVEFTGHGPVVLHVMSAPKPTGLYALKPILSNNAIQGTERVTSMQRRYSDDATLAGVNAGAVGLIRGGILDAAPAD